MRALTIATGLLLVCAATEHRAAACTNFLITRGASADGSTMITYAADSHVLYGELYHTPAGVHPEDAMMDIYEWDTGRYIGKIKQVRKTFEVVGNMNEHQLAIGETTYGGREELVDPDGGIDYGSLIYVTLQRARTAREAIRIMGALVEEYGYCSSGETFSIADPKEVWMMDMIGKGPDEKGAVWVARRVPNGYVTAHANQARIRQFPRNDPGNCIYSRDVVSFARKKGYFEGPDKEFSFADAYAPLTYTGLRICEARVWAMFRRAAPSKKIPGAWAMGDEDAKPLPLWIKPDKKLSVQDVMDLMRDHFEGTPMDLSKGVGAGPYKLPYRWRPLFWEVDGAKYFNERATSTQQTGFSFVTQSRAWLPDPIGGVFWFGVDDTFSTVYVPMYCGIHEAPRPFAAGNGNFYTFSWDAAFWVFNAVANFAYSRYCDMIEDIQVVQSELEDNFAAMQPKIDKAALKLYRRSPELARDYLTEYSARQADKTVARWRELFSYLMVKYVDGNVKVDTARGHADIVRWKLTQPGYPEDWYRRIVEENGDQFRYKKLRHEIEEEKKNEPKPSTAGWFHNRQELGDWNKLLPDDFSFEREKLLLIPGTARCDQPPRCCLAPVEGQAGAEMIVQVPKDKKPADSHAAHRQEECGTAGWLVRVPRSEARPVEPVYVEARE